MVACGARTGLLVPEGTPAGEAGLDTSVAPDGSMDSAGAEAGPDATTAPDGPIDSPTECSDVTYCDPGDPGHVYQCGHPTLTCSVLEQCEEREGGALCVNPCRDSLGNDTSNGCDFYAVEMDTTPEATGVCFAVFVV